MSWSGSGFYFGPPRQSANGSFVVETPVSADPRQAARDLYNRGDIEQALKLQSGIMLQDALQVDDYLFMGLLHHATRNPRAAEALLREAGSRFPDNASVQENLAVVLMASGAEAAAIEAVEAAIALGSTSPNLQDCLCDAQSRLGRFDLAVIAGRTALEAKDRRFGAAKPLVASPSMPPPPFNPGVPEQNVIAYTLWGDDGQYLRPLAENARILPHLFPGWTMRVYHDQAVDPAYLATLASLGVQLYPRSLPTGVPSYRRLLWRFEVIADPTVRRFLIRDADSLLTVKERVAVDAWLASLRWFHVMRDWYTHTDLILAGMWGGVGGVLPDPTILMQAYTNWRFETDHIDQDLLSETVWPSIRQSVLIHDSIFQPCLGSVPFPPFGALPVGKHIGQNAVLDLPKSV